MALILVESYGTTSGTKYLDLKNSADNDPYIGSAWGQQIQPVDQTITRASFALKTAGSPSGTGHLWAEIHKSQVGISGTYNSSVNIVGQASDKVLISTLSSSYSWVNFDFSTEAPVLNSTANWYFLVLFTDISASTTNYIRGVSNVQGSGYGELWRIRLPNTYWKKEDPKETASFRIYRGSLGGGGSTGTHYETSSSVTVNPSISASRVAELHTSSSVGVRISINAPPVATVEKEIQYYFGSYDGKVYAESDVYKSDNGTDISAYWLSKQTDFADEDIACLNVFKTVYGVKLWYKDIQANVPVTVGVSNDGGVTWDTLTKTLGNGDEKMKTSLYHFIITGNTFQFKIMNDSNDDIFQWTALEVQYEIGGEFTEYD